jgi:hypothetical protein
MPFREGMAEQGAEQPTPYRTPDRKEADIVRWGSLAFLDGLSRDQDADTCAHESADPRPGLTGSPSLPQRVNTGCRDPQRALEILTISVALCSRSLASRRACPPETRTHWLSLSS